MTSPTYALALLALAGSVAGAAAGPSKSFGGWYVECTDGADCFAKLTGEEGETSVSLVLTRKPATEAGLGLELDFSTDKAPASAIGLAADGKETLTLEPAAFHGRDGEPVLLSDDPRLAKTLLPALKKGTTVVISYSLGGTKTSVSLPLKGLVASLIFIDEAQHRDGTPSALEAKGNGPAADPASLPRDITAFADVPEAVLTAWRADPNTCDEDREPSNGIFGFSATVPEGTLYGLVCGQPGPYNALYTVYRFGEKGVVPLSFAEMAPKGPTASSLITNIEWWDRTKTITAFGKDRGLGDCGTFDKWTLATGTGDQSEGSFVLMETRRKSDCDEDFSLDQDQWPLLWPVTK